VVGGKVIEGDEVIPVTQHGIGSRDLPLAPKPVNHFVPNPFRIGPGRGVVQLAELGFCIGFHPLGQFARGHVKVPIWGLLPNSMK